MCTANQLTKPQHSTTQLRTYLPQLLLQDGLLPLGTVELELGCLKHALCCCNLSLRKQLVCTLACVGRCCCVLLCCCCQGVLQDRCGSTACMEACLVSLQEPQVSAWHCYGGARQPQTI